jgi:hypothetical protein
MRAVPDKTKQDSIGIVTAVSPDDKNLDEFTLYDIKFDFGISMLYGTQLRARERMPCPIDATQVESQRH